MSLQSSPPLVRRSIELLVELIEFKEHARIRRIERERLFKACQRRLRIMPLVEICQTKIAAHRRKHWIEFGGAFPARDCFVIAAMRVPEIAQIIRGAGIGGISALRGFKNDHVLQPIRKAIIARE